MSKKLVSVMFENERWFAGRRDELFVRHEASMPMQAPLFDAA